MEKAMSAEGKWTQEPSGRRGVSEEVKRAWVPMDADLAKRLLPQANDRGQSFVGDIAYSLFDALTASEALVADIAEALRACQRVLALLINAENRDASGPAIVTAYAQCVEAETRARAALAKGGA